MYSRKSKIRIHGLDEEPERRLETKFINSMRENLAEFSFHTITFVLTEY